MQRLLWCETTAPEPDKYRLDVLRLLRFFALLLRSALLLVAGTVLAATAFASRRGSVEVGFAPYYGLVQLSSPALDRMNERLGNSPRLSQPLKFSNQTLMGGRINIWTPGRRYVFGLDAFSSSKSLKGTSAFDDVSGAATLSLTGGSAAVGMRLLPWSPTAARRRGDWWTKVRGYGSATLGMTQIDFSNAIADPERETKIDYTYSGSTWSIGARLGLTYLVSDWFVVTLFEGSIASLQPMGASASVRSYTVSGRDEGPLATQSLLKDFGSPWVMSSMQWGFEIFL